MPTTLLARLLAPNLHLFFSLVGSHCAVHVAAASVPVLAAPTPSPASDHAMCPNQQADVVAVHAMPALNGILNTVAVAVGTEELVVHVCASVQQAHVVVGSRRLAVVAAAPSALEAFASVGSLTAATEVAAQREAEDPGPLGCLNWWQAELQQVAALERQVGARRSRSRSK